MALSRPRSSSSLRWSSALLTACIAAACGEGASANDSSSASTAAPESGEPTVAGAEPDGATVTTNTPDAVPMAPSTTDPAVPVTDPANPVPPVAAAPNTSEPTTEPATAPMNVDEPSDLGEPMEPVGVPDPIEPGDPPVVEPSDLPGEEASDPMGPIDTGPEVRCSIEVLGASLADIQTVGEVTFSTDLAGVTAAELQFGPTTEYGLVAPVDLSAPAYRTLLLGMRQSSAYHFRIVVSNGSSYCASEDQTIETGELGQAALASAMTSEGAAPGFVFTSRGNDAIIFDKQGELVWAYTFPGMVFSAMMSFDGQYVYARDAGPFDAPSGGMIYRVNIDGSGATSFDVPGGDHHDFAPMPEGFAYIAKEQAGECDRIYTVDADGENQREVIDLAAVFGHFDDQGGGAREACHVNRIHYAADGDFFTVSDREKDTVAFIDADGLVITTVGATPNDDWSQHIQAEGAHSTWRVQHGHHWYADDKLLVFTNGAMGNGSSSMLHYTLSGGTATLDWQYSDAGNSGTQGDVQALPNGNFLVTASNAGTIHEIDASQNLVGSYTATVGGGGGGSFGGARGGFGYVVHRPTLYGPPPGR